MGKIKGKNSYATNLELSTINSSVVGYYSAILTTAITIVTFGIAMIAVPISGAFCSEGCIKYPYLNTVSQFPKDYLWMFPAILLILVYLILMVSINAYAASEKKIFSQIGLLFATVSGVILLCDYFIQFSVIPVSLINGETQGIPILTQYNPHGIFIVLEDLGYLIMSLSFLFMAFVFAKKDRLESAVRWIFIIGFVLTIISLAVISSIYGIDRKDRFEVAVISIDWLVLIINGVLLSKVFSRRLKEEQESDLPIKDSNTEKK